MDSVHQVTEQKRHTSCLVSFERMVIHQMKLSNRSYGLLGYLTPFVFELALSISLGLYDRAPVPCLHVNYIPSTQFDSNLDTTPAISSSSYILKPLSLVTLANCTFFESSFSSMTCLSVLSTNTSASASVSDLWNSVCSSA